MADFLFPFDRTQGFEGRVLSVVNGHLTYCGIDKVEQPDWAGWAIVDGILSIAPDIHSASHLCNNDEALTNLVEDFFRKTIWDKSRMGELKYQELATQFFDSVVNPGPVSIGALQGLLGVKTDRVFGQVSLDAANFVKDPSGLVDLFINWRKQHYNDLVAKHPAKGIDLAGWLSRCKRSDV